MRFITNSKQSEFLNGLSAVNSVNNELKKKLIKAADLNGRARQDLAQVKR